MLDTIRVAQPLECVPHLGHGGWQPRYHPRTGKITEYFICDTGAPYISIFEAKNGLCYMTIRVSLPAFLFGSNVILPNQEQVDDALDRLSKYISQRVGMSFDCKSAAVWEVHFARDFIVGESHVYFVLQRLSEMSIPRFERGRYRDTTLYFHSKGKGKEAQKPRTICIYSKYEECVSKQRPDHVIAKARGVLRVEFRFKNADAVRRLAKLNDLASHTARDVLSKRLSDCVLDPLEKQIEKLLSVADTPSRIQRLTNQFGKRTSRLLHFLLNQHFFGKDFYKIPSLGFSRSAYYEYQRICREAGILSLFDNDGQLR